MHRFRCISSYRSSYLRGFLQTRSLFTTGLQFKQKKIPSTVSVTYDTITIPGEKKDVSLPLPPTYSPQFTEAAWYDWWVKQGCFQPSSSREKFVMLLPPPNVTGKLHIGHAFTAAIQDAIVRWNRMRGLSTLWIPGLDHAGIATQVIVEKQLWREEKLTRHDIGREEFLRRIWAWKNKKEITINSQLKSMGLSLDWSRQTFTMDDDMKDAVNHAFCDLYDQGLIYRNSRMINWSCQLRSAIADIEVDNVEIDGPTNFSIPGYNRDITLGYLTSFAYPIIHDTDSGSQEIVVSTTRLETLLGDTAIAVHPDDTRYKHLIGRRARHPFCNRNLPIIADEFVRSDLGTGAVKLTPSHSLIDHEIAVKHKLQHVEILDDSGCITNSGDQFDGMKRFDAREKVAQMLQKAGLWRGQEPHAMAVPVCSRSSDIIEPRLKEQWFIDCSEMAEKAIDAAENGELQFTPPYYRKIWYNFLQNTRNTPWCISRQLWWGHNIPAYKLVDNETEKAQTSKWIVAPDLTQAINKAKQTLGHSNFKLIQDEDVLDTWFSSSLLPFATLGWPDQTSDLVSFYPGSMIESGSDILFFWIARMVMLGHTLTGKLPFKEILIHSLLLSHGQKMSKSKGNVVDPMSVICGSTLQELQKSLKFGNLQRKELTSALAEQKKQFPNGIPECGADSLRMTLCSYPFKGDAVSIEVDHFVKQKKFCNKIWQIYKFYMQYLKEDFQLIPFDTTDGITSLDKWILDRCSHLVAVCDKNFPTADLDIITKALSSFYKQDISKIYLECSKEVLRLADDGDCSELQKTLSVAVHVLDASLRCLSPFMPYLSEELFQRLPTHDGRKSLCVSDFPSADKWRVYKDDLLAKNFTYMMNISNMISSFKTIFGFRHQSKRIGSAYVICPPAAHIPDSVLKHIAMLSKLEGLYLHTIPENEEKACQLTDEDSDFILFVDLSEHLQDPKEVNIMIERIQKILHAQTKLMEEFLKIETAEQSDKELERREHKIEGIKKELFLTETCVNYLLKHL